MYSTKSYYKILWRCFRNKLRKCKFLWFNSMRG